MSPAAEIRGVTVTCGLGAPFVLKKVPLWAHLLGRGLEELCHQEGGRGGGAAFRPLASPTLGAGAPEPPTGATDWKGGVACICSRPEGATEVVPPQAEATRSLAPPGTLPPCWGHPDWEPVGPRTQRPAVPQAQSRSPAPTPHPGRCGTTHVRLSLRGTNRPLDHLTEKSEAEPRVLGCFTRVSWWRVCSSVALRVVSSGPVSWEGLLCSKWVVFAPPPPKAVGFRQSIRCCLALGGGVHWAHGRLPGDWGGTLKT